MSFFRLKIFVILWMLTFAAGFLAWAISSLARHLYRERQRAQRRISNSKLDAAWTTRQFHAPNSQRDFK